MCSIGEDNLEDTAEKYLPNINKLSLYNCKCNKCSSTNPIVVLRQKDTYCKECFVTGTVHKFKALLGKHKLLKTGDKVLVLHKGGHASTALLHFLRSGLDAGAAKKLRFTPEFVCVNNGVLSDDLKAYYKDVKIQVENMNFKLHFLNLYEWLCDQTKLDELLTRSFDNSLMFSKNPMDRKLMNGSISQDYQRIQEKNLLVAAAKHLECSAVFMPDIAVDVASLLLTNVALGRGVHLPLDTVDDILIIRPLQMFEPKELAVYNHIHNLKVPVFVSTTESSSIQSVLKNFVENLQNNFPATINTIVRTGNKLEFDKTLYSNTNCNLCNAPVEHQSSSLTSSKATSFSSWLSSGNVANVFNYEHIKNYCYSCSKIKALNKY